MKLKNPSLVANFGLIKKLIKLLKTLSIYSTKIIKTTIICFQHFFKFYFNKLHSLKKNCKNVLCVKLQSLSSKFNKAISVKLQYQIC